MNPGRRPARRRRVAAGAAHEGVLRAANDGPAIRRDAQQCQQLAGHGERHLEQGAAVGEQVSAWSPVTSSSAQRAWRVEPGCEVWTTLKARLRSPLESQERRARGRDPTRSFAVRASRCAAAHRTTPSTAPAWCRVSRVGYRPVTRRRVPGRRGTARRPSGVSRAGLIGQLRQLGRDERFPGRCGAGTKWSSTMPGEPGLGAVALEDERPVVGGGRHAVEPGRRAAA